MNNDTLRAYCLAKKGVTEDIKWEEHLCFSVGGKMFCLTGFEEGDRVSFKVSEEVFDEYTQRDGIEQAYHMARRKWMMVTKRSALSVSEWKLLLTQSYELVKSGLTKKLQKEIDEMA